MSDFIKAGILLLIIPVLIIFGPCATIWSLNTLFHLNIETNFDTWCAAFILGGIASGGLFTRK